MHYDVSRRCVIIYTQVKKDSIGKVESSSNIVCVGTPAIYIRSSKLLAIYFNKLNLIANIFVKKDLFAV